MIEVLRPGLLATVQDLGRAGYRDGGVPVGGAADSTALRIANLLVANPPGAAGLEMTLAGPRLHFTRDTVIALAGAAMPAEVDGAPVGFWRPVRIHAGATLELGGATAGCRAYLACAGGIDVPVVLGSRSTCLPAAFGGFEGRALRAGDRLPLGEPGERSAAVRRALDGGATPWSVAPSALPDYGAELMLIPGTHAAALTAESRALLFTDNFTVSPQSDRMGCRLRGPELALANPVELTSEGVVPGTVQLPPGGAPIILLADCGTTGGYPRIGHVATIHLPLLAQLRPGDGLRFRETTVGEARSRLRARERDLLRLDDALRFRTP